MLKVGCLASLAVMLKAWVYGNHGGNVKGRVSSNPHCNVKAWVYGNHGGNVKGRWNKYSNHSSSSNICIAAGPQSLENYFQKGPLLGQKVALNLWYVDTWPKNL